MYRASCGVSLVIIKCIIKKIQNYLYLDMSLLDDIIYYGENN
jgi:hypothetical protein